MAQALPIPAGQPLEATRTAAGQVVTRAGAEAVAVQAAGSITVAALLWPLIPAARAMAGLASALGPWLPLRSLPEQQVVVMPGSGGAGQGATVPDGAPGAVRAADAITLAQPREALVDELARDARCAAGGAGGAGASAPDRGRPAQWRRWTGPGARTPLLPLLQRIGGCSDREAVDRFAFDARWRCTAGRLDFGYPGFVHTVLVD